MTVSVTLHWQAEPEDNVRLANLCGTLDANLRQLENAFDVVIHHRSHDFRVEGSAATVRLARAALERLWQRSEKALSLDDVQLAYVEAINWPETQAAGEVPAQGVEHERAQKESASAPSGVTEVAAALRSRKGRVVARTPRQAAYIEAIRTHDITFGIGPAGTGKTFLAVACAVDAFEREQVERIILTRPAVEAGERLGFLPGDLAQKVDPYLRPLYDALYDLMGAERVSKLFERGAIEIAPLAFMRGRTLNHAFIILDEAQNTTPEQMKMFLTRIGIGSKAVVTGDLTQIDLPRGSKSGLAEAVEVLAGVRGLAFQRFAREDVVRHPLVARIVDAYEAFETARRASAGEGPR